MEKTYKRSRQIVHKTIDVIIKGDKVIFNGKEIVSTETERGLFIDEKQFKTSRKLTGEELEEMEDIKQYLTRKPDPSSIFIRGKGGVILKAVDQLKFLKGR